MGRENYYKYVSQSTHSVSNLQRAGVFALEVIRLILAVVFIFSGFVKAIDPLGSTYKFEDYFNAFGGFFVELTFLAFPLAVILSTFELALGLCFLLKVKLKTTSWLAMLFMAVMLPLTLYIAVNNPVTDCGCFGDALIISNWETFYKNIAITAFVIVLLIFQGKLRPIFLAKVEWVLILLFIIIGVGLSIYSLRHLPFIDFRPYKIGVNIPEAMQVPEGKPHDKYETKLIYQKDGVNQEFTLENYPANDSTWVFVQQKSTLVQKGYQPPIHNFNIVDENQNDIKDELLHHPGNVNLLITYDINKASKQGLERAEIIYQRAKANNEPFYALTASTDEDIAKLREETGITFPFCKTDPITLKTIIRANPGLMVINNGTIVEKRNWRDY